MKQHVLLFAAVTAAAAAAGCGKSSDLAPTVAEAKGITESYQVRVAELEKRAQDILQRGGALQLGTDSPGGDQLYDAVKTIIPGMQAVVRGALIKIPQVASDEKLDEQKRADELRRYSHQIEERLAGDWVKANAKLDTAEAWLFRAESRPRMQVTPIPTPPPSQPTPEPAPAPAGGASTGAAPTP